MKKNIIKQISFLGKFFGEHEFYKFMLNYEKEDKLTKEDIDDEDPDAWATVKNERGEFLVRVYSSDCVEVYDFREDGGIGDNIACNLDGSIEIKELEFAYY